MSKELGQFDLEDRLIDFAVRIIRTAESRADFIHKMKISLKELRETSVWLLMIIRANLIKEISKLESVADENNQLISIFVASIKTANQNKKKTS